MGLAVTHGLVKRHGGTISVQSNVGEGTIFTIRLPLSQEPVRKTEEPAMRPAEGHLTILVIDDDLNIASLLERMLAKAGHRVFKALSGDEGLAIFDKEPVDLVLRSRYARDERVGCRQGHSFNLSTKRNLPSPPLFC